MARGATVRRVPAPRTPSAEAAHGATRRTARPAPADRDGRIPLVFRVGVTGHRWLADGDTAARAAVGAALADAFARCSNRSTGSTSVERAVVSSLAEGADRLAARWAVEHDLRLEVVLPVPPEDYADDFAGTSSRAEFGRLLRVAASVTVVGKQANREEAYRAAGRAVVERSDVLLAVWDGHPAQGVGGTGEIVERAGALGVPVWWLRADRDASGRPSYAPGDTRELPVTGLRSVPEMAGPLSPAAFALLDAYNRTHLRPAPDQPLGETEDPTARSIAAFYCRADRAAVRARNATLRASRALYGSAVLAVAIAAGQLVFFPEEPWLVWFEFATLMLIVAILLAARRWQLLDRWTSTRNLAERLRSGFFLALVGTTPVLGVLQTDAQEPSPATEWTDRALQEASLRSASATRASIGLEAGRALLLERWIGDQLDYHRNVAAASAHKQRISTRLAVGLFGISLLAALLHALDALSPAGGPDYWAYVSIVVPTAGAAVSGYTAQREYVRQRTRARGMLQTLLRGKASVQTAATAAELRARAEAIDLAAHGEAIEWFTSTRVHELEVP